MHSQIEDAFEVFALQDLHARKAAQGQSS